MPETPHSPPPTIGRDLTTSFNHNNDCTFIKAPRLFRYLVAAFILEMSTKEQLSQRDWQNIEAVEKDNVNDDSSDRPGRGNRPKLSWFGAWMLLIYCSIFYAAWPYTWNASMLWVRKRLPDDGGDKMIYDYNDVGSPIHTSALGISLSPILHLSPRCDYLSFS